MRRDAETTGFAFIHQDIVNCLCRHMKPSMYTLYTILQTFVPRVYPSVKRLSQLMRRRPAALQRFGGGPPRSKVFLTLGGRAASTA